MLQPRARWPVDPRSVASRIDDLLLRLGTGAGECEATVDEYFGVWLEQQRPRLATSTHHSYTLQHRYYISPHLGSLQLRDVTVATVVTWMSTLLTVGSRSGGSLSATTVRYARVLLHKVLEDAVASGDLLLNPVARTQAPYRDVNGLRRRYPASSWTIEELRLFLRLVAGHELGTLFTVMATTGLRRGEALALSWSNIEFERSELSVTHSVSTGDKKLTRGAPKRGRPRRIAIGEHAIDALRDEAERQRSAAVRARASWDNPHDLVFSDRTGSFVNPAYVTSAFRSLVPRLPVSRIRLHDLRHTHAILLLQAGMPVIDVSQRLGHSNPSVTLELYAQALQNPGHLLAETFDRLIDNRQWGPNDILAPRQTINEAT